MKPSKKAAAALKRRIQAFVPDDKSKHDQHKPGSQNRKKGWGV